MKIRNKSGLIAAVAGLTAVSLFAVGFASWVISGGDTATYEDGTITVAQVSDTDLYVFVNQAPTLDAIIFGKPETPNSFASPWLTAPEVANENLDFEFDVEVTNLNGTNCASVLSATLAASDEAKYTAAVNAGIIAAHPTNLTVTFKAAGTGATPTGIATISGSFAWGLPNGDNPYNYYNAHGAKEIVSGTTSYAADASAKLGALYTNLNGMTYSVTVTTTVPTVNP